MAERHAHGEGATGSLVLDRDLAALRLDQTPGDGQANMVAWRSGSISDCVAVPVRRATWGRLKSLYR